MSVPWVMGLDGGGSKSALAYANQDGEVVGPFLGPGISPFDQPHWSEVLDALLTRHPAPGPLRHATLGLPGYGEDARITARQEEVIRLLVPIPASVMNDVELAFYGAFEGGIGALLLSGTGSMVWASDGSRSVRAGGCGEGFGDEGSGYWIGREALSIATQTLDGRLNAQEFTRALLRQLGMPVSPPEDEQRALISWYYRQEHARSAVAALAGTVDALAQRGDMEAQALLERAADLLVRHVQAARVRLGRPGLPWSYAGGVMHSGLLRAAVTARLGVSPQPPALPPVWGALRHAALQASWSVLFQPPPIPHSFT